MTFYGESKTHVGHLPGKAITIPLLILAVLSVIGGFIELPHNFGHVVLFSDLLSPVLPGITANETLAANEWVFQVLAAVVSLGGVYIAYIFYLKRPSLLRSLESSDTAMALHRFWHSGWGFDALYNTLFVRPYVFLSTLNKRDIIDSFYTGVSRMAEGFHVMLSSTQNGVLRSYVMGIVVVALMILTISLLL